MPIVEEFTEEELNLAEEHRRKVEEAQAAIRAERARCYAEREARLAAAEKAAPVRQVREVPGRRLAELLRARLGDDAQAVAVALRNVASRDVAHELDLILSGEEMARRNAELMEAHAARHAAREANADALARQERARQLGL